MEALFAQKMYVTRVETSEQWSGRRGRCLKGRILLLSTWGGCFFFEFWGFGELVECWIMGHFIYKQNDFLI